jgi:hypothetical protein
MELFQAFEMTNNGEFHYYLDIQVHWNRPNKINHINQEKYILEKLEQFGMVNCKSSLTPMPFGMEPTFEMFPPFDIEV